MTPIAPLIPAIVPLHKRQDYINNYLTATHHTGRLMMFAGDQKIEHLNDDFYGTTDLGEIPAEDNHPEHLFKIASQAVIGLFASQLGLISRYGSSYPNINYLVKLNSKSHLHHSESNDPISLALWQVEQVLALKQAGLNILGVGYTVYLGSEFESQMLEEAAQLIYQAHQHGLLSCIWMYPRGKAISDDKSAHLIAGAAGVATCLGADFVKVNYPHQAANLPAAQALTEAVMAAGNTGVICAGGGAIPANVLLQQLHDQIHIAGAKGNATGRNIHQRNLAEAVRLCNAISAITLTNATVEEALQVYQGEVNFQLTTTV